MKKLKEILEQQNSQYSVRQAASILIILIFAVLANLFMRNAFIWGSDKDSYSYQITKNSNYQVNLIKNDFISQEVPNPVGNLNIARLVNHINTNFNYKYDSNVTADLEYTYKVTATIIATNRTGTENSGEESRVWNKTYTLVQPMKKSVKNTKSFGFEVPVVIDYQAYQNQVTSFIKQLALSIDAILQVNMTVDLNGTSQSGDVINNSSDVTLKIPLNKDVFKITNDQNVITTNILKRANEETFPKISIGYFLFGIGFFIIAIVFVVMSASEFLRHSRKSKYRTELHKILKDYDEIIIEVVTPIEVKDRNVIRVKDFNEMIDLEQELRIPILCHINEVLGYTAFCILTQDVAYIYKMKEFEKQEEVENKS